MMDVAPVAPFIAAKADLRPAQVKVASATGRSHNEWGFSNRMLDATVDLMGAK
jgi:glyceraldehyde-3-phosphate dehydrogenase/erythrose-4-phosphate dehydrogenase